MDVAGWLRALGLEQYEAAFRENDVSEEDLPHLTAEDLQDLGVVTVGHRRRLLVAIAKLQNDGVSVQAARPAGDQSASIPADDVVSHGGERRQLTVMFCDLTAISTSPSTAARARSISPSRTMKPKPVPSLSCAKRPPRFPSA